MCCLGELCLVLEPGYKPFMHDVGDIVAAMGTLISQDDLASAVQSAQTGADATILCAWC